MDDPSAQQGGKLSNESLPDLRVLRRDRECNGPRVEMANDVVDALHDALWICSAQPNFLQFTQMVRRGKRRVVVGGGRCPEIPLSLAGSIYMSSGKRCGGF